MTVRPAVLALAVATILALGASSAQALGSTVTVRTSDRIACVGVEPLYAYACVDDGIFDLVDTPTLPRP